jgi:hypothetical protein
MIAITENSSGALPRHHTANMSLKQMAQVLGGKVVNRSILCPGPGHSPHDRSLCVTPKASAPDGLLVHSYSPRDDDLACKDYVLQKLGLPPKANGKGARKTKPTKPKQELGEIAETYDYTDEEGRFLFQVVRYDPKAFRQRRRASNGRWVWDLDGVQRVPYRLQQLLETEHDTVLIPEGEKDVNNVVKLGFVATCNAGGAGKWPDEWAPYFKDRIVYILPDKDEPGEKHLQQVGKALASVAREIRVVRFPQKDVSEWIEAGGTADELAKLMEESPRWTPVEPVDPEVENVDTEPKLTYFDDCGVFVQKRWIMKGLVARGETSAWIAPPKAGKSALLTEIAVSCAAGRDWRGHKAKEACGVLILALERADLLKRRLRAYAMRDGLRNLPIAVHGGIVDLMDPACIDLIVQIAREAERQWGRSVGMIGIDTYNKGIAAGGGDEDKARDQNRVAANLRRLQQLLDVHLALVGHTGKDETRGARGSNAHLGDVDMMVQISGDIIKKADVTNANDQPERLLAQFRLEPFQIGIDEDGDPVTTAIISADQIDASAAPPASKLKLTKNERTMFELLHDAGQRGMTTEEWNEAGRNGGIGLRRRADLTDAQQGLKRKRVVREHADRWTVDHRSP